MLGDRDPEGGFGGFQRIPLATAVRRARDAWASGDYDVCLATLDRSAAAPIKGELYDEALLLRARALYRLLRYGEVVALLAPILQTFTETDASCTARMLHAAALTRSGQIDQGIPLLEVLANDAEERKAHRAVRAEIAYTRALAYWLSARFDDALRFAMAAELAHADIISARAASLRGFVALAQQRYHEALGLFRSSLDSCRAARERDDTLAEGIVLQIAALEVTLRGANEPGTHRRAEVRRVRAPDRLGGPSSLSTRTQTAALDGWLFALDGDGLRAAESMRAADEAAPSRAWRVWALAQRAAIALAFDECITARDFAEQARTLAALVQWNDTLGEERVGLLLLAEVLATVDSTSAPPLIAVYLGLPAMDRNQVLAIDPRLTALENHVRGVVARATGDASNAVSFLEGAARIYRSVGNHWQLAASLIELDAALLGVGRTWSASPHRSSSHGFYLESAALIVREHVPDSFLVRRLGGWLQACQDPVAGALPLHQREVLRLILAGLDNKQIATKLGRTYHTIRTYVADIHKAFGTHGDRELFAECLRRGIAVPIVTRW